MMDEHRQCSVMVRLWEGDRNSVSRCMLTDGHNLDRGHLMKDSNGQLFWAPDKVVDP